MSNRFSTDNVSPLARDTSEADVRDWPDVVRRLRRIERTLLRRSEALCGLRPSGERERLLSAMSRQQEQVRLLMRTAFVSATSLP